jgi:GT2 family glycosyltransferase
MNEIGAQIIFGQFPEPFLEAAVRSVAWVDYVVAVNTDSDDGNAQQNEATVRRVCRELNIDLTVERMAMHGTSFDFAKARNRALLHVPYRDYVLIVDSDDVHYPEFEQIARGAVTFGYDMVTAHFWHHAVFKNLWHSQPHREILFRMSEDVSFYNTMGTVHEELRHPRGMTNLVPGGYMYHHYGYIKSAWQVSARWEFYRKLGASVHDYDVSRPEHALDDWPRICQVYTGDHPKVAQEVLARYPIAPADIFLDPDATRNRVRVGLVMLTWNDADNLRRCLKSLQYTTEPYNLLVIDNGSTDDTLEILDRVPYKDRWESYITVLRRPGLSLAQALNVGFGYQLTQPYDYIGWIHPDMTFDWPRWLTELRKAMDEHPEIVKIGANEAGLVPEFRDGNSQCFIIRRTTLEKVGLFDENYEACGGYEDWDMNNRLLEAGKVMIWPDAIIRHVAMATRRNHDNVDAGRRNADLYHSKWGTWSQLV